MKRTNLVIDTYNLTARLRHVFWPEGVISDPEDYRLVRAFIYSLMLLVDEIQPIRVILACDSTSYKRCQFFPSYKAHRKRCENYDKHKKMCYQISKRFLPVICMKQIGYEADDIMAQLVIENEKENFHIVSTDKDLLQIKCAYPDRVVIYNPVKKQTVDFEHTDIDFLQYKALLADPGDNIPSVTGEKTALKLLRGEIDMDEWLDSGMTRSEKKPRREVFERNLKLVSLLGDNRLLDPPNIPSLNTSFSSDYDGLKEALIHLGLISWVGSEEYEKTVDRWTMWELRTMARLSHGRKSIQRPITVGA